MKRITDIVPCSIASRLHLSLSVCALDKHEVTCESRAASGVCHRKLFCARTSMWTQLTLIRESFSLARNRFAGVSPPFLIRRGPNYERERLYRRDKPIGNLCFFVMANVPEITSIGARAKDREGKATDSRQLLQSIDARIMSEFICTNHILDCF